MTMRTRTFTAALLAVLASVGAARAADRLKVVATTNDLAAVARAVGGDAVEVTTLARPTEDPHFVDPKPSFIRTLNQADVLIEGGASLEAGWLPPLLDSARNAKITPGSPGRVVASDGIPLRDVPAQLDRSMGDVHPQGNPHFMLDPALAETVAQAIANAFCAVDQAHCPQYTASLGRFRATVDAKMAAWQATLASYKGTKVVTYHKDFDYFFARFGIDVVDTLEPKPGIPPSPTHLTELVPKMRAEKVAVIVVEPYRERSNPDFVAEKTGAKVLAMPAIPPDNPPDYVAFIDADVQALAGALRTKPAAP